MHLHWRLSFSSFSGEKKNDLKNCYVNRWAMRWMDIVLKKLSMLKVRNNCCCFLLVVVVLSFFLARFRFDEDDWIDDKMRQNTSITNWMKMIPDFQTLILLFYFEFIILANDGKLNVFYDVIQLKDNFSKFITFRFAIHAWRNLSILISKILANEYFT